MSSNPIQDDLLERLSRSGKDAETFAAYIAYACEGADALAAAIESGAAASGGLPRPPAEKGAVPRAFLKSITVRSFRGIGPPQTLYLDEGRGLTIVSGRNGSGKSSFAEAAELLFTDTCSRFKTAVAADGWKNQHHKETPLISAEAMVEGIGSVTFSRKWGPDAGLDKGETVVKFPDATRPLQETGWLAASVQFRPFLAYSQLGEMFEDANSQLHDALVRGLGVEAYEAVRTTIRNAASARVKELDAAKEGAAALIALAEAARARGSDARLDAVVRLLGARHWDLDEIATYVTDAGDDDGTIAVLREVARLSGPDPDRARELAADLRSADAESRRLDRLSAGRAKALADLLDKALDVTGTGDSADCPVCSTPGVITDAWRARTQEAAGQLRTDAADAERAQRALRDARTRAVQFCTSPPAVLARLADAGLDGTTTIEAWRQLASPAADESHESLARRIEEGAAATAAALGRLIEVARAELVRREDVWRPVATALAPWVPQATHAMSGDAARLGLQKADRWLKDAIEEIRAERFAPIEDKAREYWAMLRLQSDVDLCAVKVTGAGPRRKVELDVRVQGADAKALSVMSQGELNSLALSLFLPRATMAATPFGFVVIDDPVQALDPAKVEGLARVLEKVAVTHQVVVFTHDDRLAEAVRRLGIEATFVDITRKDKSKVDIRRTRGPVKLLLEDAHAVARTEQMPDGIKLRLVPSFCRAALEAACQEVVRARRIGRGDRHDEVEDVLARNGGLRKLMALALFDDEERAGQIEQRLAAVRNAPYRQTFLACLNGAHGDFTGDALELIDRTDALVRYLRNVKGVAA